MAKSFLACSFFSRTENFESDFIISMAATHTFSTSPLEIKSAPTIKKNSQDLVRTGRFSLTIHWIIKKHFGWTSSADLHNKIQDCVC